MTIRTQRDMDNAWLAGKMKFDDWKQLYDAEQTAEQRGMMLKIVAKQLMTMPDEMKQYYEANMPQAWKQVKQLASDKPERR